MNDWTVQRAAIELRERQQAGTGHCGRFRNNLFGL
jgi:hypothetical protein